MLTLLKLASKPNPAVWICMHHRYTREIPEPAPFLSQHGAQIGGLWGFYRNWNNRGSSGACVTCINCGLSVKINTRKMPHGALRSWTHFVLRLFLRVWSAKTQRPPIWAPWLTRPLHMAVYEVWDLPCFSVAYAQKRWTRNTQWPQGCTDITINLRSNTL